MQTFSSVEAAWRRPSGMFLALPAWESSSSMLPARHCRKAFRPASGRRCNL